MLFNMLNDFAYNIIILEFIYYIINLISLAFIRTFSNLKLRIAFIQA